MKPLQSMYVIKQNKEIAPGIFELVVSAPDVAEAARPGQFVNLYLPGGVLLLPRPISIANVSVKTVTMVYAVVGAGTKLLSGLGESAQIKMMGPLGTGFFDYDGSVLQTGTAREPVGGSAESAAGVGPPLLDAPADSLPVRIAPEKRIVYLVGGGVGIPPLLFAARRLKQALHGSAVIKAFLGFSAGPWYLKEFDGICDRVFAASETAGQADFLGNVVDLLNGKADKELFAGAGAGGFSPDPRTRPVRGAQRELAPGAGSDTKGIVPAVPLVLACGPMPMLSAVAAWCAEQGIDLRVSLEERMGCGYGACSSCTCRTRVLEGKPTNGPEFTGTAGPHGVQGDAAQYSGRNRVEPAAAGIVNKKVCTDGPVFWGDEVIW
jgi:dihydroorotate dehydrogenase electron transfer subunit